MRGHLIGIADRVNWTIGDPLAFARDVRCWAYNFGRSQPPLDVVLLMAQVELRRNPTITTYKFKDGVEHRRDADPLAKVMAGFAQFAEQMNRSTDLIRDFFQALADHVNANRKS